jgi:predicted DNA-binding transcriptional regulator AlpA
MRAEAERLLDRKELAARLGIGERTVGDLVARDELPPGYLIGGVRRWAWAEVVKHLNVYKGHRHRKGRGRYDRRRSIEEPS